MADSKVNTFFVSEKISKVRWVPDQSQKCERFLTGCWDMKTNCVRLWQLKSNQYVFNVNNCEYVPECCDNVQFVGDITGLELIDANSAVASSTDGHLTLLKIKRGVDEDQLQMVERTPLLHSFEKGDNSAASCTGIATHNNDIATIGEDGRLNILSVNALQQVKHKVIADSLSLYAVAYINPQEVMVSNLMGVIRIFDIRASPDEKAAQSFMTSCQDDKTSNYVSCLASHPTQKHVVLAGSEEGSITVWDLRQPGFPASYLSAHTTAITSIGFNRQDHNTLFTTAEAGELWQWAQSSFHHPGEQEDHNNVWLNGERAKNRLNVTALLSKLRNSINSFDAKNSKIISGGDTEAIYIVDNS